MDGKALKKDIILIGMPGCGKSAIGRRLAIELSCDFFDSDAEIEKREKRRINDIFAADGEEYFRKLETTILDALIGEGKIIATGGGIVTRTENYDIIKKGIVVFLDRPLTQILGDVKTESRPLLAGGKDKLYQLYEERYKNYCSWADIKIKNDGDIAQAVKKIIKEVEEYENYGH